MDVVHQYIEDEAREEDVAAVESPASEINGQVRVAGRSSSSDVSPPPIFFSSFPATYTQYTPEKRRFAFSTRLRKMMAPLGTMVLVFLLFVTALGRRVTPVRIRDRRAVAQRVKKSPSRHAYCPRCGSPEISRSRRRFWDYPFSLFGLYPYRCLDCFKRWHWKGRNLVEQ